jgi:hypothetical protein
MDMQVGVGEIREQSQSNVIADEMRRKEEIRAKRMANLRPVQKGQVLNPTGRPKKDLDLAACAQQHAKEAIATLVEVMQDKEASPPARVSAASEILDRGFGRAPQSLDVKHHVSLSEEFETFIRRLNGQHEAPMIEATVVEAAE